MFDVVISKSITVPWMCCGKKDWLAQNALKVSCSLCHGDYGSIKSTPCWSGILLIGGLKMAKERDHGDEAGRISEIHNVWVSDTWRLRAVLKTRYTELCVLSSNSTKSRQSVRMWVYINTPVALRPGSSSIHSLFSQNQKAGREI
jgi:hypothetical protein